MPLKSSLLVGLLAAAFTCRCYAAERQATLTGSSLSVDTPCATEVDISPDAALQDRIVVTATADHQEELDRLALDTEGVTARIHAPSPGCWQPGLLDQRTLRIAVRVPARLPLGIDEAGAGRYVVGDVGGPMKVDVSGAARLESGPVTTLTADLSGAGTLKLSAVTGAATVQVSGHGTVTIGKAAIPELRVDMSGAGNVTVSSGHIDKAKLSDSGVGSVQLDAAVTDANVDLSGLGSVRLASVSGTLHKDVSGVGSVTVGR